MFSKPTALQRLCLTLAMTASLLAVSTASAAIVTTNLVGYYDFEAGTLTNRAAAVGSTAANQLGSLQALTFGTGANAVNTSSGAAVLNNTAGAAVLGYLKLAVPLGTATGTNALGANFSVSVFYKTDIPAGTVRQMVFEGDTDFDVSYGINNGTAGQGQVFNSGTPNPFTFPNATAGSSLAKPGFDNFILTFASSGASTTMTGYLNGTSVGTATVTSSVISDVGLLFGTYRSENGRAFDGSYDDIAVYNKTLTPAEATTIATVPLPEPTTYATLAISLLGFLGWQRRRQGTAA